LVFEGWAKWRKRPKFGQMWDKENEGMGKRKRRAFLANGLWRERNAIRRLEKHGKLE
jgi:hypothetical protein